MTITFTRREFVVGATAALGIMALRGEAVPVQIDQLMSKPLAEHASAKGILFGTALRGEALKNPAYADLVVSQCKIGVPEGGLKWDMLRPAPDKYDFGPGDYYYQFLTRTG